MKIKNILFLFTFSAILLLQACTEPYIPETETFDDLLVVEASITNELKKQELKLTRTYKFEENRPETVMDADVSISDNTGTIYDFQFRAADSLYVSTTEFQAVPGNEYTLNISTNDETYISDAEVLPPPNQVSVDYEKKEVDGELGVQIFANSYDPTNSSHYYRYEFQETYKVISPLYGIYEAYLQHSNALYSNYTIEYRLREGETRICYKTNHSNEIFLISTSDLSEDRVVDFPLRFISKENYILTYRYSILVTQYVESYAAYTFYETLKRISGSSGNILSPNQPGFVNGNISSVNNTNKKVIGFFDVASVSSQRIFLEYPDIYPGEQSPPFINECNVEVLNRTPPTGPKDPALGYHRLVDYIMLKKKLLYKVTGNNFSMVAPECTDCTSFASNQIPDFWE